MSHQIKQNVKQFYILMADNSIAFLEYKNLPKRVLDIHHTEVPTQHRGKGIAEQLVRHAFRYCLDNNFKVYPSCSYVQKFVRDLATEEEKNIIVEKRFRH